MSYESRGQVPPSPAAKRIRRGRPAGWASWRRNVIGAVIGMATETGAVIVYLVALLLLSLGVARL